MSKRRVVVTGIGMVTPLGLDVDSTWGNLIESKSGVRMIDSFDTSNFTTKFAGLVNDFNIEPYMSLKEARKNDMFVQYGVAAGSQSIIDSGIDSDISKLNPERIGVVFGSGIGGLDTIEKNSETMLKSGPRRISPFFIPGTIINMIAGHLSINYGLKGPNLALVTACTTGCHAIGLAARAISYGDADVMVAGGAEKASTPLGIGGFNSMRALSTRNEDPQRASRPWDKDRDGFVLGDGAGSLVLEEYEHAKARGAKIYAEVAGFGMSGDAFHITRPPEGATGGAQAMREALKDAKISADKVDYVNAHGTSTPAGDVGESVAIENVMGTNAKNVLVSSTKSMTGHLLGAAGAVESIFSILAIKNQIVPPTINLDNIEEGCNLDYVPHTARKAKVECVLSNSFGFGGTNGSVIFTKI